MVELEFLARVAGGECIPLGALALEATPDGDALAYIDRSHITALVEAREQIAHFLQLIAEAIAPTPAVLAIARVRELHAPYQPPDGHQWVSGGRAPHCKGCTTEDPYLDKAWP